MGRLAGAERERIIEWYRDGHLACSVISKRVGVSRQAVWKVLQEAGVDTSKGGGCWVEVTCGWCGEVCRKRRSQWRGFREHFCCADHYHEWLGVNGGCNYKEWRQGQRLARMLVGDMYGKLPYGSVVHHEDGNNWNNARDNLVLFVSQGDHVKWHGGERMKVVPLWVGDSGLREWCSYWCRNEPQ